MSKQQIIREITPLSNKDCFYIVERKNRGEFDFPVHVHHECELNYIENAKGAHRVIGDSIEEIDNYDLVLISDSELQHTWEQHSCKSSNIREITIQFHPDLLPDGLLDKNQFKSIKELLIKARNGVAFPMKTIMKVYTHLDNLLVDKDKGFYTVMKLLTVLYELSLCPDARMLSSSSFAKITPVVDSRRIQKAQQYINNHFTEDIKLEDLSKHVGMTTTSFCRFFKLRTGKSIIDYLIDVRIGNATHLLANTTNSILEICYECGFNNRSNFNRLFKKKKGYSPKEFRAKFHQSKALL
ncbi:AraC family transcriptional regulator [Paludibacter sp.]